MPSRPFISWSADQLKEYLEENRGVKSSVEALLVELSYRRTKAAIEIKTAAEAALAYMGATQASVETISKPRTDSRYSCFLSYAHIDQATAEKVRKLIDQSGLPSWIDLDGLNPGAEWEPALRRALDGQSSAHNRQSERHDRPIIYCR
jgi:hypothetical protein